MLFRSNNVLQGNSNKSFVFSFFISPVKHYFLSHLFESLLVVAAPPLKQRKLQMVRPPKMDLREILVGFLFLGVIWFGFEHLAVKLV